MFIAIGTQIRTWVMTSKKWTPFLLSARMCSDRSAGSDTRRTAKKLDPNSGHFWSTYARSHQSNSLILGSCCEENLGKTK